MVKQANMTEEKKSLDSTQKEGLKPTKTDRKRRWWLTIVTLIVLILAVIYGFYWYMYARFYESTDDAYVNGHIIPITPQVAGTIIDIPVDDTQYVKKGQPLVLLDPIDSEIAYQRAKANLMETVRETEQLFIRNTSLRAAALERLTDVEKARRDLLRRKEAIGVGAVSKEELIHAEETEQSTEAALVQAKSDLFLNRTLTDNTILEEHPQVKVAAAALRQAYIDYKRSNILAPVEGEIAKRSAQVGQRVGIGSSLMAVVPLNEVWVDANFKEKQIRQMRIGQSVHLTADLYGNAVVYEGTIQGFSAGTGSAFSLLPAQNATGNWIKVVQRLPVRIRLNPKEIEEHPLRIGLSMIVTVDLHDTSGPYISEISPFHSSTNIFISLKDDADTEVRQVISSTRTNINKLTQLSDANATELERLETKHDQKKKSNNL